MKKWFGSFSIFASMLVLASTLHAQAKPTATTSGGDIQAGVGFLSLNTDYAPDRNEGLSAWADYDFSKYIGVEVLGHFGGIIAKDDIGENSYEVGPRARYRRGKFEVIGKLTFGRATISNQLYNTSSSFNIYAFGGGLDYRIKPRYKIRVDYEEQKWGNFEPHTLSPTALSIGVLYVIRGNR